MSERVFGHEYADQYDLLYSDKDYEAECDLLEEVFKRYGDGNVHKILDLGCGTGNHAIILARRGYLVTGVDRSAEMLVHARRKVQNLPEPVVADRLTFLQGDIRTLDLARYFDAVLMMFAVLSYQLTNEDVLTALRTVRRHLRPGGLLAADVWYGPAVLSIRPCDRVKVIPAVDGKIIRVASSILDVYRHLCEVRFQMWRLNNQRVVNESEELHRMRFFFPQELALVLELTQHQLIHLSGFPNLEQTVNESTWNALLIAKAISNDVE